MLAAAVSTSANCLIVNPIILQNCQLQSSEYVLINLINSRADRAGWIFGAIEYENQMYNLLFHFDRTRWILIVPPR